MKHMEKLHKLDKREEKKTEVLAKQELDQTGKALAKIQTEVSTGILFNRVIKGSESHWKGEIKKKKLP